MRNGQNTNTTSGSVDPRLLNILECRRCHSELELLADRLSCRSGHNYFEREPHPRRTGRQRLQRPFRVKCVECERKGRCGCAISCESPREKRKQGVRMMRKIAIAALIALAVGPAF